MGTISAVETIVRNSLLAKAVRKVGLQAVAARLGITETQLRQYAVAGIEVPDALWMRIVDPKSGLISEIISQPVSQFLPESKGDPKSPPASPG